MDDFEKYMKERMEFLKSLLEGCEGGTQEHDMLCASYSEVRDMATAYQKYNEQG